MPTSIPHRVVRPRGTAVTALLLACLFSAVIAPAHAQEEPAAVGQSRLAGTVLAADGKQPVGGVTVVLLELATGKLTRSAPTSTKGRFEIPGLMSGYYELSIESAEGAYVGNRIVDVAPSSKEQITVTLAPLDAAAAAAAAARLPAGAGDVGGEARVGERATGREFWKGPKGIAILAGGGAAALLLLATSDNSTETVASPF